MLLTSINTIPEALIYRDHPVTVFVGIGMFLSFIIIALAKLIKPDVYSTLMVSFIKNKGLSNYIRESFPLQKGGSILLILNYLISFSLLIMLILEIKTFNFSSEILAILITPFFFMIFHVVILYLLGVITGEHEVFKTPLIIKINGIQFIGLACSIMVFFWTLNFIDQRLFIEIVFSLFILETITRILRSFVYVLNVGVSWYYIIMYFCTLEILPLFILYYIFVGMA